ncbi:hypothetical protein Acid345_4613 [Candidatus Koribacter versatilis Ellin345]|uniref:Uncharacterized protein n=1 Tax=Koribacter versatilis (strain Ellin345) TaxID=204669 RepID=Q1IHN7_KORVE|nr:hypothetical protein [Candidatus Koribacter versatilis]ABF43613.1 hypothetical protein Acid345_4613 [Candidatus Koribacter versatilis Ellin345]
MKKLQRITEAEVINDFLQNEFYQGEFHHDRDRFEDLVLNADTTSERDNAIRRALLFRRRGHMWRELPDDTQWWQIDVEPEDMKHIRVFPRAQWRKVSNGSFLISDIVQRIKTQRFRGQTRGFVAKIQSLSYRLRVSKDDSSVMLIGIDEQHPLTILEGNHRLTAALLASPALLQQRFKIFCGLSPRMAESCWYETNLPNLWRYAKNRARNFTYDKDADVELVEKQFAQQGQNSHPNLAASSAAAARPYSESTK